jgi:FkbM family methyltransferase
VGHYHFVEVGTSNFRTLCQFVDGTDCTCTLGNALPTVDIWKCHGISVEPVAYLLRELPDFIGLKKVPVALGERDGYDTIHFVPEERAHLQRGMGGDALYFATGTSMLGKTHPQLQEKLLEEGLCPHEVMEERPVQVWSFRTLAQTFRLGTLSILKLDCEGCDLQVLRGMLNYCMDGNLEALPRLLQFETNRLTNQDDVAAMLKRLEAVGYQVVSRGTDTVLKKAWPYRRGADLTKAEICCDYLRGVCTFGRDKCYLDHPKWDCSNPYWNYVFDAFANNRIGCYRGSECAHGGHDNGPACCKDCSRAGEGAFAYNTFYCEKCWEPWRSPQN